jgi:hypothetical protein
MESREEEPGGSQQSSKRPDPAVQPDCLLAIGSQRLPAILGGESATGLYVLIQGSPLFWVEDTGVLRTSEAELAVCVANIVRMETEEDDLASNIPAFRIGLTRLAGTMYPWSAEGALRPQSALLPLRKARPKLLSLVTPTMSTWCPRLRVSLGGLIACAMIVTPLALVAAVWHHAHQADTAHSPTRAVITQSTQPSIVEDGAQNSMTAAPAPSQEILRLPGVEPFLNPDVARKLELTPSQTSTFGRLDKTTQAALQDLEKYWESAGRLELARRRNVLLEAARQEALQLLTDQQRQQWDAMTR